ncbi:hypothetical protein SVIOM342S_03486 [Streptomyces violaceorubidus]
MRSVPRQLAVRLVGDGFLEPFVADVFARGDEGDVENHESAFVLCQCFVPAGTRITVPGSMLTGSSPSAWYQPLPAVHSRTWSPPPPVPWWMCQLLRQPGSKETLLTGMLPRRAEPGSSGR